MEMEGIRKMIERVESYTNFTIYIQTGEQPLKLNNNEYQFDYSNSYYLKAFNRESWKSYFIPYSSILYIEI